jgi:hypothetical protein
MLRWRGMPRARLAVVAFAVLAHLACGDQEAVQTEPAPYPKWRRATDPDGRELRIVERGAYRAVYDSAGDLLRIEYDSNGDGRPDHFAHHDGAPKARLLEIDTDYDGTINRWEHYDPDGRLVKVGSSRRGETPDRWAYLGPDGLASRMEYDSDGDGRVDRVEVLEQGRLVRVEVDADRDGRLDRWQDWRSGVLSAEELDTNGDGKPDRRLLYGTSGNVETVEPLRDE